MSDHADTIREARIAFREAVARLTRYVETRGVVQREDGPVVTIPKIEDVAAVLAALSAVEQERDGQQLVAKMALDDLDAQRERAEAAEREVVRLKAQLAGVRTIAESYAALASEAPTPMAAVVVLRMAEKILALASVSGADAPPLAANETAMCRIHGAYYSGFERCPTCAAMSGADATEEQG